MFNVQCLTDATLTFERIQTFPLVVRFGKPVDSLDSRGFVDSTGGEGETDLEIPRPGSKLCPQQRQRVHNASWHWGRAVDGFESCIEANVVECDDVVARPDVTCGGGMS